MGIVDQKEDDRAIVADEAYAALSEMTSENELRKIAQAVADSNVPYEAITDIFLLKVLLNTRLYTGWESLPNLVSGTKRQGLYPRNFGTVANARAKGTGTTRIRRVLTLPERPGSEATNRFRQAVELVRLSLMDAVLPPFIETLKTEVGEWRSLMPNDEVHTNRSPVDFVSSALDKRISRAGENPISLIPVDRYLSMVIMQKPYDVCMKALERVSDLVRLNMRMPERAGKNALDYYTLPAGDAFRKRFLRGSFEPYDNAYYSRHRFGVWTAMLESFAFSLAGRDTDCQIASAELIKELSGFLGGETKKRFMSFAPGSLCCFLRDDDKDAFGYRTAIFGVYDANVAKDLAVLAAQSRYEAMSNNYSNDSIALAMMKKDFGVHGASTCPGTNPVELFRFGVSFGKWRIW